MSLRFKANIYEILNSISRKIGFLLPPMDSVEQAIEFVLKKLEEFDDEIILPTTIEDLLAIEENVLSAVLEAIETIGEPPINTLTPLARLYYTEYRGVSIEEASKMMNEHEDILFEQFLRLNMGKRLTVKQLRNYLKYVLQFFKEFSKS